MNYYYADSQNQVVGPVPLDEIHALARRGVIGLDTHVLPEGQEQWQQYRSLLPNIPPPAKSLVPVRRKTQIIELTPVYPSSTAAPVAVPAIKECPFCAEPVAVAAKKCKHCGEIIDVTLRAAEEAKRAHSNQPMIFMNAGGGASSSSSSSAAVAVTGGRRKRIGCFGCLGWAILAFILFSILSAIINHGSRSTLPSPTPTLSPSFSPRSTPAYSPGFTPRPTHP